MVKMTRFFRLSFFVCGCCHSLFSFFVTFLSVYLFIHVLLYYHCFEDGQIDGSDSLLLPCPAVSPSLNQVPSYFFLGSSFNSCELSFRHNHGTRTASKPLGRPIVHLISLLILLAGDIEVNPGPSLRFAQLNAQSLGSSSVIDKSLALVDFIMDNGIDFLALSETWLKSNSLPMELNAFTPAGYSFFHNPRNEGRGGGVGFLFRSAFRFTRLNLPEFTSFELISGKLTMDSASYIFVNIYRPPSCSASSFLLEFSTLLEHLVSSPSEIFLSGDFNFHVNNKNDSIANSFTSLLDAFGLHQLIDFPTHNHGHTLDLFITRESCKWAENFCPTALPFSDHLAVQCTLCFPCKVRQPQLVKHGRNFKTFNYSSFCHELLSSGIQSISNVDLDLFVNAFNSTISKLLDKYAPLKFFKVCNKETKPFYTNDIRLQKKLRSKLESAWRRDKSAENFASYKEQTKIVAKLVRSAKRLHYRNLIQANSHKPKKLWSILNSLCSRDKLKVLPSGVSDSSLATQFAVFFDSKIKKLCARFIPDILPNIPPHTSPSTAPPLLSEFAPASLEEVENAILAATDASCSLDILPTKVLKKCLPALINPITKIVNLCLAEGKFPTAMKIATVLPLLKKYSMPKDDLNSYRPISNLNFISKIVERIVHTRVMAHLNSYPALSKFQSAYRAFHSTESALLRIQDDLLRAIDKRHLSALVLLDLSAAFDTIDHRFMLSRLSSYFGFRDTVLKFFNSYLDLRSQSVMIGSQLSSPTIISTGVPQGSVLGPLLFSMYTTPLGDLLENCDVKFHFYADDTQIYLSFPSIDYAAASSRLSSVLNKVHAWFTVNRLSLNPGKTEYLIVGTTQQRSKLNSVGNLSLDFAGNKVCPSEEVRNLGVLFDPDLSYKAHISKTCQNSFMIIRHFRRIRDNLSNESAVLLANTLVSSRLDYCNSLFFGLPNSTLCKLQSVQNCLARVVSNAGRYDHITPILRRLHWLPISLRVQFKIATLVFNILCNRSPSYLSELVKKVPQSNRRSSDKNLLVIPLMSSANGQRSFSYAAPKVWNSLPQSIRDCTSVSSFRNKLKAFLFPT